MSIFRESFPQFVRSELDRRQNGILSRNPQFVHQLNTRSAWVRMTSGVNYDDSNELAKKYVLQGGTLTDATSLKYGLGKNGTSSYDRLSPGGNKLRTGIRPMPGIAGVSVKSKGAYGSLQEATVSFVAWDIRQLEELELLYMRPGYTVLLEFGWNYTKPPIPKYDILNKSNISLNDAFTEIYDLIIKSEGNYDALLGYVTNYNWVARDDGGYDCTTTIISLGEVLESLKVNWVPLNTKAFDRGGKGIFNLNLPAAVPAIFDSYEQGIIPGLLHELWVYLDNQNATKTAGVVFNDPTFFNDYYLYINENSNTLGQNDRGGYPKPLGKDIRTEAYISLGSFCDLLNNYVLLKDINDNPLSQVTAYETDQNGNPITTTKEVVPPINAAPKLANSLNEIIDDRRKASQNTPTISRIPGSTTNIPSSLKCIASPLAISTNLGVCLVRNDNWKSLEVKETKSAEDQEIEETISAPAKRISDDIVLALKYRFLGEARGAVPGNVYRRFQNKIDNPGDGNYYTYSGNLEADIEALAQEFLDAVTDVKVKLVDKEGVTTQEVTLIFADEFEFKPSNFGDNVQKIDLLSYFNRGTTPDSNPESAYFSLFFGDYDGPINSRNGIKENPAKEGNVFEETSGRLWTQPEIVELIKRSFINIDTNPFIKRQLAETLPEVANLIANTAANTFGLSSDIQEFLVPTTSNSLKTIGNISNIYLNINFLYSQAISKNVASNDTQNKNIISIREYLQGILKEVQNSLGNINDFDIQVDNRNAIGRIIDINFTGDPDQINLYELQIQNLKSVVRNYNFQSKIFPEMSSIIAISAQDPEAVGRLGYDNATLVAWNEGIKDRLIPKKDFTSLIKLSNPNDPVTFIYPFLTKMFKYFKSLEGSSSTNLNFAYGGLNFAYRDFLAYLNSNDPRNSFKGIIPTELSVTLDGIGGIVIGNLFSINQDIVPKGYKSIDNRQLAYIITKIGHDIQSNDWTTTLGAYPIIFENAKGVDISKGWDNDEYPGNDPGTIRISVNGVPISISKVNFVPREERIRSFGKIKSGVPIGFRPLLDTIAYTEGTAGAGQDGYDILVGSGLIPGWNPDYTSGHPNVKVFIESINNYSTAAGRYQFLYSTWEGLGFKEFNRKNQDEAAYQLLRNLGIAITDPTQIFEVAQQQINDNSINVNNNPKFLEFLNKTYQTWASLPNSSGQYAYSGQGGRYTPSDVYSIYIEAFKKNFPWALTSTTSSTNQETSPETIAKILNDAGDGIGTNEDQFITGVRLIKDKETFIKVNSALINNYGFETGLEELLKQELGTNDPSTLNNLKTNLAKIGVTLNYTLERGIVQDSYDIKITF